MNDPTCFPACMCVFPSAACVCFINSRAALKAPPGRKRDIHWSNETLFWAFTFTLFYGDLCVCTGFTRSLERSHFIQPESGGVFFCCCCCCQSQRVSRQRCEEEAPVLLGDNVITKLSRKCRSAIRPVNSYATVLSLCSQTAATLESTCGGISARCCFT